jgi:hypothetical protein
MEATDILNQIDNLLSLPQQMWLLGAGVSKEAGIPLMHPLTDRVSAILKGEQQAAFESLKAEIDGNAHVEHVLSHLCDLLAVAARCKTKAVIVGTKKYSDKELAELHSAILLAIRDTVRWGFIPKADGSDEKVGSKDDPIVKVEQHQRFVDAIFSQRRANFERRPPVAFFTTNYDTLLEDALALSRVCTSDGFSGGAMAFWFSDEGAAGYDNPFTQAGALRSRVFKLHGSIDWYASAEDVVVRLRDGAGYPKDAANRLLIYPQATKYQVTQKDPFASLFRAFRNALCHPEEGVLLICGYSFGDDHINEEIERSLRQRNNRLNVLAFVKQSDGELGDSEGLSAALVKWLGKESGQWKEKLIVAGSRGVYHGSLENLLPAGEKTHPWWSFSGLTELLQHGPGVSK